MLPSRTLSQIRHVRVMEYYMSLPGIEHGRQLVYKFFNIDWALKLLPGLCLDTLTVIATSFGSSAYWAFDGSIRHGNGWRELRVITSTCDLLGFARALLSEPTRTPQPRAWKNMLHERDSADSGALVVVYRSTVFGVTGSVTSPHTRQVFEQNPAPEGLEGFGREKDVDLTWKPRGRVGKEMLVVVRRGRHACIVEHEHHPLLDGDIRLWTKCATWREIRHHQTTALKRDGCLYYPGMEKHYEVEVDRYDEVQEYSYDRCKLDTGP
jgi:hypothetical protein